MKILGRNFVFGRTIDEALRRAGPERSRGLTHSFDMLGEAARTSSPAGESALTR
jgi:RHH-type proline utilization regulon transcriptional repressor/proline dehydrogenase/delta 1-pyrroline-5-carboxylate dehydrogenase